MVSARDHVDLDFWGAEVRVSSVASGDLDHLRAHFPGHLASPGKCPPVAVHLATGSGNPFYRAVLDPADPKEVWLRTGDGAWELYERFLTRSTRESLIPPFGLPPLRSTVRPVHAAAVRHPASGGALLLHGESGAGKTSLLLALLERGFQFMSDDVTPVRADGHALPYGRPLNVREQSLDLVPRRAAAIGALRPPVPTLSGAVHLVHPAQLGYAIWDRPAPLAGAVALHAAAEYRFGRRGTVWALDFHAPTDAHRAAADLTAALDAKAA